MLLVVSPNLCLDRIVVVPNLTRGTSSISSGRPFSRKMWANSPAALSAAGWPW